MPYGWFHNYRTVLSTMRDPLRWLEDNSAISQRAFGGVILSIRRLGSAILFNLANSRSIFGAWSATYISACSL